MPWIATFFSPREQLDALLGCELTPELARLGHLRILTGPPECGTPNFARRSEFRLQAVRANRVSGGTDSISPDRLKAGLQTLRRDWL